MLRQVKYKDEEAFNQLIASRNHAVDPSVTLRVTNILDDVRERKDEALREYTKQFDQVDIQDFLVSDQEIEACLKQVDDQFMSDLEAAKANIMFYHQVQVRQGYELTQADGVYLGQKVLPLSRVGVYVPGGTAAYPSTVLMDVVPANIAGVKEIIMVTPPNKDGKMNPYIIAAAKIAGVDQIYKIGGAQAIGALAYGTQSVPRVDKIVGPGNIFVAVAKKQVYGKVDIDMIAGPSEILVIADEGADPSYIAADLMSQAEHDPLASSILVATSQTTIDAVNRELEKQLKERKRQTIITSSLEDYGYALLVDSIKQAIEVSNAIAPEHLELMVEDAKQYLDLVEHAGSVFLGYYTCESIGDYFGGTNHVLPTSGTARFYSGLGVDSFIKKTSYIHWSKEALQKDGDKIINIANFEGLDAHAYAVKVRMDDGND